MGFLVLGAVGAVFVVVVLVYLQLAWQGRRW
jgi:hypothetical protein